MSIELYTTRMCPYCVNAKRLLSSLSIPFKEIPVDGDPDLRAKVMRRSGQRTVPQIWIGSYHVGGCDELYALHRQGKLPDLISQHIK